MIWSSCATGSSISSHSSRCPTKGSSHNSFTTSTRMSWPPFLSITRNTVVPGKPFRTAQTPLFNLASFIGRFRWMFALLTSVIYHTFIQATLPKLYRSTAVFVIRENP